MNTIVLYSPQIPQNTGNIVRTCAITGSNLVLVEPLGFKTSSRMLRRAGLDYWDGVNVKIISDLEVFLSSTGSFYFYSSKAKQNYSSIIYKSGDILVFGSETSGLPKDIRIKWPNNFYTIPMISNQRCLNLSNAVAIVIYEAWRQQKFVNSSNKIL